MKPHPKPKRVKLKPTEYTKFKRNLWENAMCRCQVCNFYLPYEYVSLHHIKSRGSGGGDIDNCMVVCLECHRKIHDGVIKI